MWGFKKLKKNKKSCNVYALRTSYYMCYLVAHIYQDISITEKIMQYKELLF